MKLALCLYKYFPYGGLQRDFLRILKECHQRGHSVHVYTAEWQGERPNGVALHVLRSSRIGGNHVRDRRFFSRLQKALSNTHFDAVIGFNKMPGLDLYYGADFCYLGRTAPQHRPLYRFMPRYRHHYAFERAVFSRDSETQILSLSRREKSVYQQYYGTPEERFHMLPATLDLDRQPAIDRSGIRASIRQDLNVASSNILLFFIGSGFKTKGLDRALTALAHLPDDLAEQTRLVIVGQDQAGPYQRLAQKLGVADRVQFLGGRTDIPDLLAAGDLLIHPAHAENTGTVLLEAIAAGLPVIATDVCGYADHIVKAVAGKVLASPFDQDELDRHLATALVSPERDTWSQNGQRYGADPNLYHMPASAVDAIESAVQRRQQGAPSEKPVTNSWVYLRRDLDNLGDFHQIMAVKGESFREAPGRKTVRFAKDKKNYFLKTHTGVGWQEIIKNLFYFRLPVLGAMNEWHGAHHLQRLGIDTLTLAGYGTESGNPARRRSFIITDEILDTQSLEEFCSAWRKRPPRQAHEIRYKRWLIQSLAQIARRLHNSGANHRDFYLVHFLLQPGVVNGKLHADASRLFVIDLHRMQLRRPGHTPKRWKIKDVAGLHYSSMDLGLTTRDLLRFIRLYSQAPLRETLDRDRQFWKRVERRANRLYAAEQRRLPASDIAPAQTLHSAGTQP
jgi:UDP-glucose:(heptosyl)LPS alpha-1,3-glucosyltransferase